MRDLPVEMGRDHGQGQQGREPRLGRGEGVRVGSSNSGLCADSVNV